MIGKVTSGAFGPSLSKPIGMGYIATDPKTKKTLPDGATIKILVRGKPVDATITKLPFVAAKYYKP